MKKLLFIFSLFFVVFSATAQSKSTGLPDIVKELQTKFNVSISYDADLKVEISQKNKAEILQQRTIEKALDKLTSSTNLKYKKLRSDYFVITKKDEATTTYNLNPVNIEQREITGVVYDEDGKPLPGATVVEKGTNNATMTDLNGKFTLQVTDAAQAIVVSFMGYKDQEVTLTTETNYEIYLEPDNFNLEAVVVSGVAGKTPVKKLTVTVSHLDADQVNEAPASSASSALQGKIPGVVVTQAGGQPGAGSAIRLRGVTSLNGDNAPLVIVDGIMVQTSLADFNVDDIESIEVVKGAAASALYGSKAAGGVIVITTKRGKNIDEGYQVTVRNEFGTSQLPKRLQLATHHPYQLDSNYQDYTYTRYANVDYDDDGNVIGGSRILTDSGYADQPYAIIRDHQREFFENGNYYTNYVGVATKSKESNLFISFENHHNEGIIFNTNGYTRRNLRFNADTKIGKYIKLSTSNLLINSFSDKPGSNNSFFDLLFINPDVDLTATNDDGSPYKILPDPWSIEENPLYPLWYRERQTSKNTFMTNVKASVFLTKWLTWDNKYTFEKLNKFWRTYTPKGYLYGGGADVGGKIYFEQYTSTYQTFQSTFNIKKTLGDFLVKSKLSYMYEDRSYYDFAITGRDFVVPNIPQLNNTDNTRASMSSYDGAIVAIDMFAILDVDYKSKYLFSGLYRRDGSSLFGENERWQNYYRVAGAYRITEDVKIPGFQELKIRSSYGVSGLRPGFSWQYETYTVSSGNVTATTLGNKNLRPAEAKELEFAVDAEFLKIFSFYGSYSITNTEGAFVYAPLPAFLGYPYQWKNAADIHSTSLEFSLGIMPVNNDNFSWKTQFNFDKIEQEVSKLDIQPYYTGPEDAYYIAAGEPFGILYGYKWVRSLDDMANQLPEGRTIDDYTINSDGYVILKGTEGSTQERPILYSNDGDTIPDRVLIGDGNADLHLGFANTLNIENLTLYFLVDWKQGGDVYNYTHQFTFRDGRAIEFDQSLKPEDQKKSVYYYSEFYQHSVLNDYFVEDGTYVKLREFSVYYTFYPKKLGWSLVKSVKLGVVGRNLYTFTKYTGYDPEVAYSGDLTTFAFDKFGYPNFRTISASIKLQF